MIQISSENVIQTTPSKKRGRPRKSVDNKIDLEFRVQQLEQSMVDIEHFSTEKQQSEKRLYDFKHLFKKIEGLNRVIEYKIKGYTQEELETYMEDPIRYASLLIDINNFMYNRNGFFREFIDYLVKPILYRWTVNTEIKNQKFYKEKEDKIQKNFLEFVNRIISLNLGKELKRILTKMCLEDAVYGYWLEDGNNSTVYYLPSNWCVIRSTMNGLWSYSIDSKKPSNRDIQYLPKEIASLINKHRIKSGDEAYAPVPYEKSLCFKINDHIQYVFPPFCYVILSILRVMKLMEISDAKDELEAMNLITMEIPISEKEDDHLILTENIVTQFVETARSIVSELVGIIPTPMKMSAIPLSKTNSVDKDTVKNAIDSYGEEVNMPSFGAANSGAELKRSIENTSSKMFSVLDQISQSINLKLKIEGYNYPSYDFVFEILHVNEFNKVEVQENLLKQCQAGLFMKMRLLGSFGMNPAQYLGQSHMENILFKNVIDNATVFPTAYTQSSSSETGRPTVSEDLLEPSTIETKTRDSNNPDNRQS